MISCPEDISDCFCDRIGVGIRQCYVAVEVVVAVKEVLSWWVSFLIMPCLVPEGYKQTLKQPWPGILQRL